MTREGTPGRPGTRRRGGKPRDAEEVNGVCALTGRSLPSRNLVPLSVLRPRLMERILTDHPELDPDARIAREEAVRYRQIYAEEILRDERGELTRLEREVARSLEAELVSLADIERDYAEQRRLGERLSDGLATFGGSWSFLIAFALFLALWIVGNAWFAPASFDPYPFILLNLILSCLAAVQAPIIMMSQKRQEAKDRLRAQNDYKVNLKAELEVRHLHEKVDHLLSRQWERLAELQQLQIEIMEENAGRERR